MELVEIDDDDVEAFLVESYENLDQIERNIIELEKTSDHQQALDQIYRSLHTLKGNCGFLPFPKLESLAHAGENLLSSVRDAMKSSLLDDRNLQVTPEIINILLQTVDTIRQILSHIKATKRESDDDYTTLIQALNQLQQTQKLILTSPLPQEHPSEPTETAITGLESAHIRVNVNLLDQIMNLVGELVLVHNQVIELSSTFKDPIFNTTCQRLSLITSQLQEGVMKTRLQPISTIWQKFPRVVRDLAIALGKQVEIEMQGSDTEFDKSIIEAIKDPLTHLVRNCIDHGIELPTERTASGKPTTGKLLLKAFHENGKVNIEISDDGRGLDVAQLKARAQRLGLISAVQAKAISDAEAINLIFLPGFSTTEKVTAFSGRGVGMDVVKNNIEKINGSIEIDSQPKQGTTFKIKIPLTLTIMPALIVTNQGDRYAIPQVNLQELVRVEPEQAQKNIEIFYDVPVYRLREHLIPLVYLSQVLAPDNHPCGEVKNQKSKVKTFSDIPQLPQPPQIPQLFSSPTPNSLFTLVIVQADNYQFGIVVDTIEDILDIVVKPLGKQLKTLSLFAGATIMADGTVALIIDVVNLAKLAQLNDKRQRLSSMSESNIPQAASDRQMILLFHGPQGSPMGIPIHMTFRLERISRTTIEKVGNQDVVRYHDKILPLIDLQTIFPGDEQVSPQTLQIIIVSPTSELSVALVVEEILDVVEEQLTITGLPSRPGVAFCAVIQGQITEILDIEKVIKMTNPYLLQVSERG